MKKQQDHLLPLFKGKAVISIFDTMNHSHIKSLNDEEKENLKLVAKQLIEFSKKHESLK